jgi:vancomycin resistance protein YoaR
VTSASQNPISGVSTPRRSRRGFWLFLIVLLEIVILAAVGVIVSYQYRYAGRIYDGVTVAGIPVAGMTEAEAARVIREEMTPYPGAPVILRFQDRTWVVGPEDLGVEVDAAATAKLAFAVGRQGAGAFLDGLRADLTEQADTLARGRAVKPVLRYDDSKIDSVLQRLAGEINLAPREATLTINGLDISSAPGLDGRELETEPARELLTVLARNGAGGVVDLTAQQKPPAIRSTEAAAEQARETLSKPVMLTAEGLNGKQVFAIDRAMMADWLTFTPAPAGDGAVKLDLAVDRARIEAYLTEIAKTIDLPVYDARLDFDPETNQVVVLNPSTAGQKLDLEAATAMIEDALLTGKRDLTLPVTALFPKVDSNKIAEMGITELVSAATTYFKGSSKERVHNIVTAAEKFRGVVIPPGEQFSFNQNVGDVSAANGFVDSLIISGDRTELGVGGGVCQVSTTAFQAAFWGGFPILERYPHSYAVSWYNPPGLDATIFTPTADFRFRNDSGSYLLIRPEVDAAKGQVTFYIYGTKDRTAEMIGKPEVSNVRPAPPPVYEESKTLAEGQIKQVDWAKEGKDVTVRRRITFNDGNVKEDKFVSKYQPWRSVYLYGPGTQVPAGN